MRHPLKAAVKKYLWDRGVVPGEPRTRAGQGDPASLVFGDGAEQAARSRA